MAATQTTTHHHGRETAGEPVIAVDGLTVVYATRSGPVEAVHDVSFCIHAGQTLGLVGESGCGKSTVAYSLVNALGPNGRVQAGRIRFEGQDLVGKSRRELRRLRGNRIAMVFQDPMQALNPSLRIGRQLTEVLTAHRPMGTAEAKRQAEAMLQRVHMPDPRRVMERFAHQLSGGQQQRVVIAMALLNRPSLLLMDEPTTALDVTVEAAVLDLIADLKSEFRTANLFITHNLGVVARISDRVCVMYAGRVVEEAATDVLFSRPHHPYTRGLIGCIPRLDAGRHHAALRPIAGRVPRPDQRPADGCVFAPRCRFRQPACTRQAVEMVQVAPGHRVRCLRAGRLPEKADGVRRRRWGAPAAAPDEPSKPPLLSVQAVQIHYRHRGSSIRRLLGLDKRRWVRAVDGVDLQLDKGRTLGIVGESGCGKSSLVKGIIGLEPIAGGTIDFLGLRLDRPVRRRTQEAIRHIQMVFQNPDATLNPAYSVGRQIARPLVRLAKIDKRNVHQQVIDLLKAVRLGPSYYHRLPRQLSGGEKQRIAIARALAARPELILCDEPVSALDVSVQAAVLNLLVEIQERLGTALVFIAHDLSVVRYLADDVAVMYLGQVVEAGPAETIYRPPYHPYTEALLSAAPCLQPAAVAPIRLEGGAPSALEPPAGCRFHPRCPRRSLLPSNGAVCAHQPPPWRLAGNGHRIRCHIDAGTLSRLPAAV